jgi:hypothetical protein
MAERIKQDDPGFRRLKITRASSGSMGHSAVEEDVKVPTADEEQNMILSGLDAIVANAGSTGFGAFVQKAVSANRSESHGYVDDNGMPHSRPAEGATGFAAFQSRQAGDGREDHNYTEQQKVTQPTTGFGAGEGIDTNMEEDRRDTLDDGGTMSTAELMQKIQELLPKEERFRIPPEKKDQPPAKGKEPVRMADDSTPDGTQWQSEVVDETSPRDRNLPDIPEPLPEKYVPEKGDGSHPLPNESFEDWGTPPVPGVSQNYPEDPAKLTNIMGSLTRIRLSDGRVLIGKVVAENQMKLKFFGRVAGDRADSSFELWKRDIIGSREAVRVKRSDIRQAREIINLDNAYDIYNRTREAKDQKKDYVVEKAIVSPSDGVDRSVERATNTRGAGKMNKTVLADENDLLKRLTDAGIETDHHESDLYVDDTPEALQIINQYQQEVNNYVGITRFKDNGGKSWLEVPFAYSPFWANKTAAEIIHEASRRLVKNSGKRISKPAITDMEDSTSIIRQDIEDMMDRNPGMDPEVILRIVKDNNPDMSEQELTEIMDSVRTGSRRMADMIQDGNGNNLDLGDEVVMAGTDDQEGKITAIDSQRRKVMVLWNDGLENNSTPPEELIKISSRQAADESKEKTVTPATAPKGNVATNDTMKDETFYGDDKALHDQLDKHEKRASILKREARVCLKMADNYEKAGNLKMAKEMDKQGTALYTEWRKETATIAGINKQAAIQRKITADTRPKLFFENQIAEDKNNPFA